MKNCLPTLFAVFVAASFCPSLQAQILSEDYSLETVGEGTYSGGWEYIYAEQVLGTTVSSLNIRNGASSGGGDGSPVGGNYLEFKSAIGDRASAQYAKFDPLLQTWDFKSATTNAWESPVGHFRRQEMLEAGATYAVSLWRRIEINEGGYTGNAFSIWDGSTVDTITPFLSTPGSLLTYQAYDFNTGGWQEVSLTFTAPGAPGSGNVPVDFMMGTYAPSEPPGGGMDWDGNPRTVDIPAAGYIDNSAYGYYYQWEALALDNFTVTQISPVPEPSVTVLGALGALLLTRRGARDRGTARSHRS